MLYKRRLQENGLLKMGKDGVIEQVTHLGCAVVVGKKDCRCVW